MPTIVISYRRADAAGTAGRMFDKLTSHFGDGHVFMDIDSIPAGTNFRRYLRDILSHSDIVLAVMGPRWMGEGGRRRIAEDTDLVRFEVQTALEQNIPLIPVLVDHADMPRAEDLPDGLKDLVDLNAVEVGPGRDFHVHMDRLIRSIETLLKAPKPAPDMVARPTDAAEMVPEEEQADEPAIARLLSELSQSAIAVGKSAAAQPADSLSSPAPNRGASNVAATSDDTRAEPRGNDAEVTPAPDFLRSPLRNSVAPANVSSQLQSPQPQANNDNSRRARRRHLIALALIGYAIVATAGAYRYRAHHADEGPPPVIVADSVIPKVAPSTRPFRIVPPKEQPVLLGADPASLPKEKTAQATDQLPSKTVRTVAVKRSEADNGAPATSASTPNAAVTGGYVVQVSSQRNESEAQASFRALQAKYPDQLGGRSVLIRRADFGDRGVYYRAFVGPFASAEEAGQFCAGLKAAGGQCIIQRN